MKRVTGIGGIFFKCKDPQQITEWYKKHLGFQCDSYGANFEWRSTDNPEQRRYTLWSPFKESTTYFQPSNREFMINFQVEDLEALIPVLKAEGVDVVGEIQVFPYGKFAHVMDPEGNKVELWESNPEEYAKIMETPTTH